MTQTLDFVLVFVSSLAFADTQYYVTDPNVIHVPVKEMLSKVCSIRTLPILSVLISLLL